MKDRWSAVFVAVMMAAVSSIVVGAMITREPGSGTPRNVQRMIDQMRSDAAARTPEPCISFTTRGFVPCP